MPKKYFVIEIKTISLLMRIRLLFRKKIISIDIVNDSCFYIISIFHKGNLYILKTGNVSSLDKLF